MNREEKIRALLDGLARSGIPEGNNPWSRIQTRLEGENRNRKTLAIRIALMVLVGLTIAAAAYTIYCWQAGPGLEGAWKAGLITTLNISRQVPTNTLAPTQTPDPHTLFAIPTSVDLVPLGRRRAGEITINILWAYADAGRIVIAYSVSGLDVSPRSSPTGPFQAVARVRLTDDAGSNYPDVYIGPMPDPDWDPRNPIEGALDFISNDTGVPVSGPFTAEGYGSSALFNPGPDFTGKETLSFHLKMELTDEPILYYPKGDQPDWSAEWGRAHILGSVDIDFSIPLYAGIQLAPMQKSSSNGIEMTLEWIKIYPTSTELQVCFNPPDGQLWGVGTFDVAFYRDGRETGTFPGGGMGGGGGEQKIERICNPLSVDAFAGVHPEKIVIRVGELIRPLDIEGCQDLLKILDQRKTGVKLLCPAVDKGGPYEILEHPPGMSEEEVNQIISDAYFDVIAGDWMFTVDIP